MQKKRLTNLRLSPAGKRLREVLAAQLGMSQAAALEICIREHTRRWAVRDKENPMPNVRSALINLQHQFALFCDVGGDLRTNLDLVCDTAVNDPTWAHLAPLAEHMRTKVLEAVNQVVDAFPSALKEAMENAHAWAGE
jgi:hypothetical protein